MTTPYSSLGGRDGIPPGSTWGRFGDDDELGMVNLLGPQQVLNGVACVVDGIAFNLDHPLDAFDPPVSRVRKLLRQEIYQNHRDHRDEFIDRLYPQVSSHIDGLRHRRHEKHGYYNGVPDEAVVVGSARLGIQRWAARGIAGRGVLLDLVSHVERQGRSLDHREAAAITVDTLDAILEEQEVVMQPGDMVLIRTGWARFYLEGVGADERARIAHHPVSSGLAQSRDTLRWLWERQVPLVAADNLAVEVIPPDPSSPFESDVDGGLMHPEMIALVGLALGELWDLDALAHACAQDGRYAFLLVVKPWNLPGGVGSPANALAIR